MQKLAKYRLTNHKKTVINKLLTKLTLRFLLKTMSSSKKLNSFSSFSSFEQTPPSKNHQKTRWTRPSHVGPWTKPLKNSKTSIPDVDTRSTIVNNNSSIHADGFQFDDIDEFATTSETSTAEASTTIEAELSVENSGSQTASSVDRVLVESVEKPLVQISHGTMVQV